MERALTFRDARIDDAAELADLGRDTFSETFGHLYPPSDLRHYLDETFSIDAMRTDLGDPKVEVRVAFAGRRMIAYCKLGSVKLPMDPAPEHSLELHRIYVSEARQGVGVGRILLAWAIDRARQRAARFLFLGVWQNNLRAITVYESRGFERFGGYKLAIGNTLDDEIIMRLAL